MKRTLIFLGICGSLLTNGLVQAQIPGAPSTGFGVALLQLFGKTTAFTAKADLRMKDKTGEELASVILPVSFLEGKIRADVDLTTVKSTELAPEAIAQLKVMGMDKMTMIVQPATNQMLLIYPNMKSYVKMPLSKSVTNITDKAPKLDKTALGNETIDGHPCVKNKVILTSDDGEKKEMTVWNATDLKDFPVKMQSTESGNTVVIVFKEVVFIKPAATQFEAPAGFKKYDDAQQMLMEKLMENNGAKK